ncbi:transposase, IS630 family [Methylomarinovum tepidoasis]|uniref:Transposase, IS630 family n=1 Tax=Methylomarinovum tepidoasis TaxID=2840183 RepID=A0AAU9C7V9_9GAMM|nr:IS630 family transposase [Methylomarinovum sp. IN45]BCX89344.1 transposase, IS630 family [Methylomarinovum sp. IN45]
MSFQQIERRCQNINPAEFFRTNWVQLCVMKRERIDARKLDPAAREQLRKVVIRLYERGYRPTQIAKDLGLRRPTVSEWIARVKAGQGTGEKKRGRRVGSGRRLTPAQEARIYQEIVAKTPDRLGLPYALWNAQAVRMLIRRSFGIDLPKRTVRLYLQRWGMTPQRPVKRAYERDSAAVKQWLEATYPRIQARARQEQAEIHWGDETGVVTVEHAPRGYAPRGKPPVLAQSKRERMNLIASITAQGKVRFMLYPDTLKAAILIEFLRRLIQDTERKVFLILDNHRVHHSSGVTPLQWTVPHFGSESRPCAGYADARS